MHCRGAWLNPFGHLSRLYSILDCNIFAEHETLGHRASGNITDETLILDALTDGALQDIYSLDRYVRGELLDKRKPLARHMLTAMTTICQHPMILQTRKSPLQKFVELGDELYGEDQRKWFHRWPLDEREIVLELRNIDARIGQFTSILALLMQAGRQYDLQFPVIQLVFEYLCTRRLPFMIMSNGHHRREITKAMMSVYFGYLSFECTTIYYILKDSHFDINLNIVTEENKDRSLQTCKLMRQYSRVKQEQLCFLKFAILQWARINARIWDVVEQVDEEDEDELGVAR